MSEAERYLAGEQVTSKHTVQKFYAVKNGKVPGIYTDWPSAQAQVQGWSKPKHKSFPTRYEAQVWLDSDLPDTPSVSDIQSVNGNSFFTSNQNKQANAAIKPPTTKKRKNMPDTKPTDFFEYDEDFFAPGFGPLPPGSVDGFDRNIRLDSDGNLVYKTMEERQATRKVYSDVDQTRPIRVHTDGSSLSNGQQGAMAGIGVYFGPGDKR